MKVFLENFSAENIIEVCSVVPQAELVDTVEDSDFWFTENTPVEEVIDILLHGVEVEDSEEASPEDLEQRVA